LAAADVKLPSGLSAAPLSAAKPAGKQNPAQMNAPAERVPGGGVRLETAAAG
jgi:hypothetical protein